MSLPLLPVTNAERDDSDLREWYRNLHERPEFVEEAKRQRERIEVEMAKPLKERWRLR